MAHRQPWYDMTQDLVAVAMGRKPADLVICNGRWVNVHSGEILPGTDVAVYGGRVAFVDQYRADTVTSFTEYRVILNYEVTWKGSRR